MLTISNVGGRPKNANQTNTLVEISANTGKMTTAVVNLSSVVCEYYMQKKVANRTGGNVPSTSREQDLATPAQEEEEEDNFISPYINYDEVERLSRTTKRKTVWAPPPLPPSPEPDWHICTIECPAYCSKVYEK